jgi:phosphatidylglycerol---prolipoprotein diacylglyceryl transferase
MNPVLFEVPWFGRAIPYHSYGFFLAVAFLVGMAYATREGRKQGIKGDDTVTVAFVGIVASLIGSRLLHLLMVERAAFFADPGIFLEFSKGGYAFYGGFLLAMPSLYLVSRYKKIHFLQVFDYMTPGMALGLAFGRTGCLLAGCCHGRPVGTPLPEWLLSVIPLKWPEWFALTFPSGSGGLGSLPDQALVPTQPMSGLYSIAIFLFLALWIIPRKRYHGQVFVWFCIVYAFCRSVVELFRGDDRGLYFSDTLSTSQLVSVPVVFIGVGVLLWARGRIAAGKTAPLAEDWMEQGKAATEEAATPSRGKVKKRKRR